MYTLSLIKLRAKTLNADDIKRGKAYANRYRKWDLWWSFDCVEMYQRLSRSSYKVFWWQMVVKTLRYANYYYRQKEAQK